VCLVVLTGPVGLTLCCPANGAWLGVWFLDGGTHFCTNIYTDDHCLSHSDPRLVESGNSLEGSSHGLSKVSTVALALRG
jgi:hypothetical protein